MYWGHGYGMAWGWVAAFLALLALAALILLVVRSFTADPRGPAGPPSGPPPGHGTQPRSDARAILDERLARGEVTPDEYREIRRALDETWPPGG